MSLPNELISQFVKAIKNDSSDKNETTVYGTTVEHDGKMYVRFDGSELLTPVQTTAATVPDERVTVMIKNHTATVTGNITSPAARVGDVGDISDEITEIEILIADKASIEDLEVERARIDVLVAGNVEVDGTITANAADIYELKAADVTINQKLTAAEADIENLQTNKLDANVADITYATIKELEATNADLHNLEATYGEFEALSTNKFNAINASIADLDANKLDAETANITYATIAEMDAVEADISLLKADVADIDTLKADVADIDALIFGSASGNTIQTSFANSVIAQLGDAQIKSAMIKDVSADKIKAGDIITNNVRVKSQNGLLLISDETIQISDNTRVRVQIGKDAVGDYSINIWDTNGNLMFSEGGITDSAIKEAIIRNDMVSDTANIAAHKLNIDSLFEEINGSTNTIKSTQIYLDDEAQTLDVAFKSMETEVSAMGTNVSSQGTQLSILQGQIDSKIWQQDIEGAIEDVEVGGRNLIGFHNGVSINKLTDISTVTKDEETYGAVATLVSEGQAGILLRIAKLNFNVLNVGNEPFTFSAMMSSTIEECYVYVDICDETGVSALLGTTPQKVVCTAYPTRYCTSDDSYNGFVDISLSHIYPVGTQIILENIKVERGTKATDFTVAPEDLEYVTDNLDTRTSVLSTQFSTLEQTVNGLTSTVGSHTAELSNKADSSDVISVTDRVSTLEQTSDEFKSTVEKTYATKSEFDILDAKVETAESAIEQNATAIELRVTQNELLDALNDVDVGGRNLLLDTASEVVIPETEEFTSYSKQKIYKFVPTVADDLKGFVFGLKNGESITLSYEVNIPRAYKDSGLTLSRIGAYIPFTFTSSDGTKAYWYGTHIYDSIKTNRHTIETIGSNSLTNLVETETAYIGRYACYVTPTDLNVTVLKNFFTNPDDYTVTCSGVTIEFGGYTTGGTISNVKMEVGTKATDWTPAPEDLETRVSTAESTIKQHADGITSLVTKTTENADSISTLQQTSDSLTSRVSTVEKIEIGARNLAIGTSESKTHTMENVSGNDSWYTCSSYFSHGILLEIGQSYTLSFDYILDWGDVVVPTEASQIGVGVGSDNGTNTPGAYTQDTFAMVADLWTYGSGKYDSGKFVYTFTNYKDYELYFAFRMLRSYSYDVTGVTMTISNFKLEQGNKPTDWTPAPEDMATAKDNELAQNTAEAAQETATNAETLVQQLSESISMLVTDGNGTSLMTQTDSGWTFSTAEIQSSISSAAENLDALNNELGNTNNTVEVLQQAVADLGEIAEYVKIGTYEDEPCIELGEGDSEFKLRITNTRILFMEGSSVIAHFTNQSLFIKKAVIEEELQQGEFVWKARANGNLGLIWKGVNS